MLIQSAFQLFLIDHESYCAGKTLIYYKENVPKFFNYLSKQLNKEQNQLECEVISRDLVLAYIVALRASGIKNTSVNTYFRAVKVFLNYCIDEEYCSSDVLRKVKFLKSDKEPVIPLTASEVEQIDGLFNSRTESGIRNLCIVHLMLDAGFRCSDVVNLRIDNINFDANYLTVRGKGDKIRSVLLCPRLKRLLFHYLVKFRVVSSGDDDPVFTQIGTADPINSNVIKQLFARIKNKTGIARAHPHLLRHTFATSYILGGGNMEFLRLMLGHSDYETTKIYLHLAQETKMLHNEIYKLDPVFFRSTY